VKQSGTIFNFLAMKVIRTVLLLILTLSFPMGFTFRSEENASIRIHLPNVKEGKGEILIALFNKEKGFPEEGALAFRNWRLPPAKNLTLTGIPSGKYALAILHDLDDNQKMTFNILGIPKEGYASSPDGGPKLSKPQFKNALFLHAGKGTDLTIPIYY
jgi:uncharacterized protein (DUF2141 family)